MNKNTIVKFSLTLVSAAVLAACGSSGGKVVDAVKKPVDTVKNTLTDAQKAAKEKAAKEEAAKKAAAEKAAKEAAAKKAAAEKAAKEAAAKEAKVKSTEEVGHKFVQKTESNLNVGTGVAKNSHASTSATSMRIELDPSLDTIVVAVPLDKNGKASKTAPQAYLEDYDFRKSEAELAVDNKDGLTELRHVYIGKNTNSGAARNVEAQHLTKTQTKGLDTGVAVVYEAGRLNYTDYEGDNVVDPKVQRTQAFLKTIDVDNKYATKYDAKLHQKRGSLSEVYGYRTFAVGNSEVDEQVTEAKLANAPFTTLVDAKNERYADGKLVHVQYGRVTSNLHAAHESAFRDGKKLGDYGTKVVGFGKYGSEGTENHYFYRGVDDTKYSATLASDLGKYYHGANKAEGKLQYQGHALTYGISHKFQSTDGIPNAIGYKQELVSGTHVAANVDLATKQVTGQLYDVWRHGNRTDKGFKVERNEIANFQGKLENNGSISGKSVRTEDGDKGTFNANLFGAKAEELGGAIRSHDSLQKKQWGAVFGAEIQNSPYVATPAKPAKPAPTPIPAWGESTDQKDTNSPIR